MKERRFASRQLVVTAVAVCLTAVAGCGGTSRAADSTSSGGASPSGAHASFIATVEQVCARAVAAHAGHAFPLANFDPENPRPSQLPVVGDYFAQYGGLPQTTTALHALTPPAADATAWNALLDLADQISANAQRQIAAAQASDVSSFIQTVATAKQLTTAINSAGAQFGFSQESACGQVFG
jgi:hypothetical protein